MLDMTPVMDRTYYILKEYPDSRNDDKLLIALYMEVHHDSFSYWDAVGAHHIPQYKSIERCRRWLQKRFKEIEPNAETAKARRHAEIEYHAAIRYLNKHGYSRQDAPVKPKKRNKYIIPITDMKKIEKEWMKEYGKVHLRQEEENQEERQAG